MARLIPMLLATVLAAVLTTALAFAPNPGASKSVPDAVPLKDNAALPSKSVEAPAISSNANPVQSASRDVGSGMVASTVAPGTVLERIEPVAPPAKAEEPVPRNTLPSDAQKRWRVVYNSVVTSAGVFDLNGMSIVLPGIDVVSADETCMTSGGRNWPCGTAARTAFRAFVRNRALNCHLPVSRQDKAIVAECLLQGEDPAEWLVAQGWARASPGGPFDGLEKQAKESSNGIFGNPPTGIGINSAGSTDFLPEAQIDEAIVP